VADRLGDCLSQKEIRFDRAVDTVGETIDKPTLAAPSIQIDLGHGQFLDIVIAGNAQEVHKLMGGSPRQLAPRIYVQANTAKPFGAFAVSRAIRACAQTASAGE
jgi:hypothetical protein